MTRRAARRRQRSSAGPQPPPAAARARSPRRPSRGRRRRLVLLVAAGVGILLALLIGFNVWMGTRPPAADAAAVHSDIAGGHSGAEVTFQARLTADPTRSGDHERMEVADRLGDDLELDYNTDLGTWVPARRGDSIEVHGQLYIDPGRAGVHCLHGQTSSGCPQPGWIRFGGTTYS